jgi:hypothetical protein
MTLRTKTNTRTAEGFGDETMGVFTASGGIEGESYDKKSEQSRSAQRTTRNVRAAVT